MEGWGKVGYVLTCIGRPAPAIRWLQTWESRSKAESWMLYNLVIMYHQCRRFGDAAQVLRHIVGLPHSEGIYQTVHTWTAFEEALAGNLEQAGRHLASLPKEPSAETARIRELACLLVDRGDPTLPPPANWDHEVKSRIKNVFAGTPPSRADPYSRSGYLRFFRRVPSGWRLKLWKHGFFIGWAEWGAILAAVIGLLAALRACR